MTLDLETARFLVAACRAAGARQGLRPLAVAVLDAGGHLVASERENGASIHRHDIAFAKAYGALALGVGSRALMARAEQQPTFVAAATAAIGGRLVPVPGGVLVHTREGDLIGAIGVSGDTSDNDERAAVAAIEPVDLVPQVD